MKKNFLLITPFLPYKNCPHAGGKFVFKILKFLSKTYYVTLVTRVEPAQIKFLNEINIYCKNIYSYDYESPTSKKLIDKLNIIYSYFMLVQLAIKVIKENSFDFIQIEFIETGLFYFHHSSAKLIVNAHDLISIVSRRKLQQANFFMRLIIFPKYLIIKFVEKLVIYKTDLVWVRSNVDKTYLMKNTFYKSISVFPIPISNNLRVSINKKKRVQKLLFVGALNRKLNEDASIYIINNILPDITKDYPNIKLILAGNAPSENLINLAKFNDNVEITGFIDDIAHIYEENSIFVSPIFIGGGMIYKNLEAFSYGIPVITTNIGNYGIDARADIEIIIANSSDEFIDKIKILLSNKELSKKIGSNGREFLRKNFDESKIFSNVLVELNNLYNGTNES